MFVYSIRLSAQNMISFTRQVLLAKDDAKDFPSSDNYRLRQSYNNIHRIYIYIYRNMYVVYIERVFVCV